MAETTSVMGNSDGHQQLPLRVYFLPMMSPGHMIPMVDMAKLFATHGLSATIITTPGNEPHVRPAVDQANFSSPPLTHPIDLLLVPFPSSARHLLPGGHENIGSIRASERMGIMMALFSLIDPIIDLLRSHRPDCIVSDSLFTWTAAAARDLGIPRLVFHGPGIFLLCVHHSIELNKPHLKVANDDEPFIVADLPHRVSMTRAELSEIFVLNPDFVAEIREAEENSYGVVVNSFYELEPDYAELFKKWPGRRAWYLGPLSLCNRDNDAKPNKGGHQLPPPGSELGAWLSWLDSKPTSSVVYVCFGSLCELSAEQLLEIALGLEASGHPFIWVVRSVGKVAVDGSWMPEGFLKRIEGHGMVLTGWAPQVLILEHPTVGAFVTHCGWNSTLEGVCAGVPMVTWPLGFDQFVNEKLITEVLEIGVRVKTGGEEKSGVLVNRDAVARSVEKVMGAGEEAEAIRQRAKQHAAKAKAAVEEGGSSHDDMQRLVDDLLECRRRKMENSVSSYDRKSETQQLHARTG